MDNFQAWSPHNRSDMADIGIPGCLCTVATQGRVKLISQSSSNLVSHTLQPAGGADKMFFKCTEQVLVWQAAPHNVNSPNFSTRQADLCVFLGYGGSPL